MGNYEDEVFAKEDRNSFYPNFTVVKDSQNEKLEAGEQEVAGIKILIVDLVELLGIVSGKI